MPRLFGITRPRIVVPRGVFDITTQNWDGLFLPSFAPNTWNGTASTGTSGARSVTNATMPPSAGTPVNGFAPASFNGSQYLEDSGGFSQYVTSTSGTILLVLKIASISGGTGTSYDNQGIITTLTGANLSVCVGSLTNNKFFIRLFGPSGEFSAQIMAPIGTYTMFKLRWDSAVPVAEVGTNNGSWTAVTGAGAFPGMNALTNPMGIGKNWDSSKSSVMDLLGACLSKSLRNDAFINDTRSYFNGTFPSISV